MKFELSSGGLVYRNGEILLIRTKNLKGDKVWALPKGKIEKGESAREAALREVEEETGYQCSIVSKYFEKDVIYVAEYFFRRERDLYKKKVTWFLMYPQEKTSTPDQEILTTKWIGISFCDDYLSYDTDEELVNLVRNKLTNA